MTDWIKQQLECLLILVFAFTCLSGCGSAKLSRSRAKSLIAEESHFKENVTFELSIPETYEREFKFNVIKPTILALEKAGLINITLTKCGYWQAPNDVCCVVDITEKGVEASKGWTAKTITSLDFHGKLFA